MKTYNKIVLVQAEPMTDVAFNRMVDKTDWHGLRVPFKVKTSLAPRPGFCKIERGCKCWLEKSVFEVLYTKKL